jgi:serine/threonine protein kinase
MAAETPPRQLQIGAIISHYRITDTLGAGGMGVVYRAVDTRLNRTVALKVIGDAATSADRRQRFISEARAASAFIHDVMREMLDWFDRFLGPVTAVSR